MKIPRQQEIEKNLKRKQSNLKENEEDQADAVAEDENSTRKM